MIRTELHTFLKLPADFKGFHCKINQVFPVWNTHTCNIMIRVAGQQVYHRHFIKILCSQYSLIYLVERYSNTMYTKPVNRNSLKFLFLQLGQFDLMKKFET